MFVGARKPLLIILPSNKCIHLIMIDEFLPKMFRDGGENLTFIK